MTIQQMFFSARKPRLFGSDGSSLAGWTLSPSNPTVFASDGVPAPSLRATGGQYAFILPQGLTSSSSFTITADVKVISGTVPLCNLFFGCNVSGAGWFLRLDTRVNTFSGIASSTSWTVWNAPSSGPRVTANVWYSVRIEVTSSATASWYLNDVLQASGVSVGPLQGGYMAIHGDSGAVTGGLYDNINVFLGIN